MSDISLDFDKIPDQPFHFGAGVIISSILFFLSLNFIITLVGEPQNIKVDFKRWRNLLISWIHAIIVGIWDILCFYFYPEMWADLILFHNPFIYIMVAFSTGYFIYDFFDIIYTGRTKTSWEVLVHHVFVAGIFFYNVATCRCIAYNVLALMAEINSMFLHSRKILQVKSVDFAHPIYRINVHLNLLTFILGRFGGLVAISYGMWYWSDRVTTTYYLFLSSSMTCMTIINTILFYRLIKNDVMRPLVPRTKTKPAPYANNNVKENGDSHLIHKNGDAHLNGYTHQNGCITQKHSLKQE